jgi:transposase
MSGRQISVHKIKRLAEIHNCKGPLPISHFANELRVSRSTVRRYFGRIKKSGYSFTELAKLRPKKIRAILKKATTQQNSPKPYIPLMKVFEKTNQRLFDGSATRKTSWIYYRNRNPNGYGYSQFVANFRAWQGTQGVELGRCTPWHIHIKKEDMAELLKWRHSNNRTDWAMAVAVLDSNKRTGLTSLCTKIEKSPRLVRRWLKTYKQTGLEGLRRSEKKRLNPEKVLEMETKRDRIIGVLHESPHLHGINRASWSLETLARAYERQYGDSIGRSTISEYVRAEGYAFRKARRVLTSPDPNYREKLQKIKGILSNLRADEKFFSVDEFGPFSVKMRGGRMLTRKGETRVVPQREKSRGRLILTGALELSTNQITYFYSEKKNTEEMIKLLETLLRQYSNQRCLYLSWDVASWHISGKLKTLVSQINSAVENGESPQPLVKLVPLPASAQFLNVIESVFSGMARAILHNSDYQCVDECKKAIDQYFADRNEAYKRNPKRAGNKIWGRELVESCFKESNNCKDPNWR